ncbi:helix-turn-helix domain-containing protein [Clostridium sp.]|uniref:helix-turn-helix domain-containing protein n=1 Tax=Clostridium sp. TaxID=1506 RepID=UPI0032178FDB
MSTIRVIKDSDNPYVMLNKTALNDNNLSFKAKGIFAYLMSKPDDWACQVEDLQKHAADGRDSVKAGLRELREHGYIIKRPIKNELGRIDYWEETIFETPQEEAKEIFREQTKNEKPKKSKKKMPQTEKPLVDENNNNSINVFPASGNSNSGKHVPLLSNNTNNNEFNNNDISTTQSNACSNTDELKTIIENETHLVITPNQNKKLSNWNKERLIIAIDIFKNLNGKYFAFLEKIYKDNGNFVPKNKISKSGTGKFHSYDQRNYNFEELERKLLGWDK